MTNSEIKKDQESAEHGQDVQFTVVNEDNGHEFELKAGGGTPVATLIERMYAKLGLAQKPDDRLRCEDSGEDVFAFSSMKVKEYLAAGHCAGLVWLFAGGTGGATQ